MTRAPLVLAFGIACHHAASNEVAQPLASLDRVTAPPIGLGLPSFYEKYVDDEGIPIVSSHAVDDRALLRARVLLHHLLLKRPDARSRIVRAHIRIAIIGRHEQVLDIPEYATLASEPTDTPGLGWNARARGLGATTARPVTSGAEENILCLRPDRYFGENIFVHEVGHTIAEIGLADDVGFNARLADAYAEARKNKRWEGTYAASNVNEYWAEGVQSWFGANTGEPWPQDSADARAHLATYDAPLFSLLHDVFIDDEWRATCPPA